MLTVHNTSIRTQIQQLKKITPNSAKHAASINWKLKELEPKQTHELFAENPDGSLSVPPGFWYLGEMKSEAHKNDISPVLMGDERYYQKEIVNELLKYKRSCITACTGSGKSRVIRDIVTSYVNAGKRVLVCVPSIELLSQTAKTIDSGLEHFGFDKCGQLGNGKRPKDGKMAVISTIQSALNIVDIFDVILFDELHVIAAESYQKVAAGALRAQYMHGLTATIDRPDGLTPLIYAWCGKCVYEYSYERAVGDGFLAPIKYFPRTVHSAARTSNNMQPIKEYIALHSDALFIEKIAELVNKSLDHGRKTLVLFKASECGEKLAEKMNTQAVNGKYRKPLKDFIAGKTDLLIGNTALLSTGWDCPEISSIIFVASGTSEIMLLQSIGRGTRIAPNKKDCIVVDVSVDHPKYLNQGRSRKDVAVKIGYDVIT